MRFDIQGLLRELSLEENRARLGPVLDAVQAYERCKRARAVMMAIAAITTVPLLVLALAPAFRALTWSGLFVLIDAIAILAFAWALIREQAARRALRRRLDAAQTSP